MDNTPRFTGIIRETEGSDSDAENNSFTLFNNLYAGSQPEKLKKQKPSKTRPPKDVLLAKPEGNYNGLSYFTFNDVIFSKMQNIGAKNMEESMPSIYNEISKDAKSRKQQYPQNLFDVPTKDLLAKYINKYEMDDHRATPQINNTNPARAESLYSTTSIDNNDAGVDYYTAFTPPQTKQNYPPKQKKTKENKFNGDMYCGFLPNMEASPAPASEKKNKEPLPEVQKKQSQTTTNFNNYLPTMNPATNQTSRMPKTAASFRPAPKPLNPSVHHQQAKTSIDSGSTISQHYDRLAKKNSASKLGLIPDMKRTTESPPRATKFQKLRELSNGRQNILNSSFEDAANKAIHGPNGDTLEPGTQPKIKVDPRPATTSVDIRRTKERSYTMSGTESRKLLKDHLAEPNTREREKTVDRNTDKSVERPLIEKSIEKSKNFDTTEKNDVVKAEKTPPVVQSQKARPKSPPKSMYQPKNNMDKIEQTIKHKGGLDHNADMAQYLRKRGLKENTKIFSFNSRDDHIKRALKKYGWIENPTAGSFLFDFKWSYTDIEADYNLMDGQYFNHFLNNREITTKSGLINILKNSNQSGIDMWQFFPRAYDLGHVTELKEFREDFERTSLINLLKNHWNLFLKKVDPKIIEKVKQKFLNKASKKKSDLPIKRKYKEYVYSATPKNPQFVVQMRIIEVVLNCSRALVQQFKDLGEESHFKTFAQLNVKTQSMIMHYSKFKNLEKLAPQDKIRIGGSESDWETPNETLIYKVYKFLEYFRKYIPQCDIDGISNLWIIKPSGNSRGSGIFLVDSLESALDSGAKNQARIVQKYIENPLILRDFPLEFVNNKKFDIRQWVLVSSLSPLKIYLFSSSYMRICSANFDLSDIKDNMKHLTNFSLNKTNFKNNLEESICETELLKKYLKVNRNIDWETEIKPKIVDIVSNTLVIGAEKLEERPGCFELYGFDLLLDEHCNPWLLEVNLSPACSERVNWLTEMLDDMADGLLNIILPPTYLVPVKNDLEKCPESPDKKNSEAVEAPVTKIEQNSEKILRYSWDLIYEGDSKQDTANMNPLLEIVGKSVALKKERELDRKFYSHVASICLQKNIRMYLCKRRKLHLKERKMAIIIQRRARVILAKNELQRRKEKKAALMIEDVLRIVQAIKIKTNLKRQKAATKIQAHYRKMCCVKLRKRLAYIKLVTNIQSWWRMIRAKKAKLALRTRLAFTIRIQRFWKKYFKNLVKKAIKVQSIARVVKAKNLLKLARKRYRACIKIQKTVRMFFAKIAKKELFFQKQAIKLKTKMLFESKKRFIRGLVVNKKYSDFFDKLNQVFISHCFKIIKYRAEKRNKAAKVLQGLCKIRKAKRKLRRLKRVKASKKIQSIWRMLRQRKLYLRTKALKGAAIIIQKNYKMIIARRQYHEILSKIELEKYTKLVREQLERERQQKEQEKKQIQLLKIQKQLEIQAKQKEHMSFLAQPPGMRPGYKPREKKSLPLQPKDYPMNSITNANTATTTTTANTTTTTTNTNTITSYSKIASSVVSGKTSASNLPTPNSNLIHQQQPLQGPRKDPYEVLNNIYTRKQNVVQVKPTKPGTAQPKPTTMIKDTSEIRRYEETNFDALYNIFAKNQSKLY